MIKLFRFMIMFVTILNIHSMIAQIDTTQCKIVKTITLNPAVVTDAATYTAFIQPLKPITDINKEYNACLIDIGKIQPSYDNLNDIKNRLLQLSFLTQDGVTLTAIIGDKKKYGSKFSSKKAELVAYSFEKLKEKTCAKTTAPTSGTGGGGTASQTLEERITNLEKKVEPIESSQIWFWILGILGTILGLAGTIMGIIVLSKDDTTVPGNPATNNQALQKLQKDLETQLEKINREISTLKTETNNKFSGLSRNTNVGDSKGSNDMPPPIIVEPPKIETKQRVQYANVPQNGVFDIRYFSDSSDGECYYKIIFVNENTAEYELTDNSEKLQSAFNILDSFVKPGVDLEGRGKPEVKNLKSFNITRGKLKKDGENWRIQTRMKLKY